jgi:hypothetical protein
MSFGLLHVKIREMEERLDKIETSPISQPAMSSSTLSSDIDSERLNNLLNECSINSTSITRLYSDLGNYATKDELVHLATKGELVSLATKDELVSLATASPSTNNDVSSHVIDYLTAISSRATKDELATLATATKDELATLATKDELVTLATKDELVPLATKDELVPLATKDELVPLATKDELVPLATKDELVPLATKDELAELLAKFDNIINIVGQLNTRIDDLAAKITV